MHAPSPGAPHGLYVYDVAERVVLVSTHGARPVRPLSGQLGEPDARLPSRMPGFKTIWLWAARGLALHLDDVAADVVDGGGEAGAAPAEVPWLYAFAPMSVDAFRGSWLAQVSLHRTRVR